MGAITLCMDGLWGHCFSLRGWPLVFSQMKTGFESPELRKFIESGNAIVAATGTTFEQWAEGEMGLILKGTAGAVAAQTVNQAETRARNRSLNKLGLTKGEITINSGVRGPEGRTWVRTKNKRWRLAGIVAHNAGQFHPENIHFAAEQWRDVQGGVQDYQSQSGIIVLAKRTIGLARQSVIQMADAVGILIERIAGGRGLSSHEITQARSAVASDGKTYQNGFGSRQRSATSFSIEVINRYPNAQAAKIDVALAESIGSRAAVFGEVLGTKLAQSTARVAKAFPYLQVR
ncbi:MAG TPA: hypothetical protein VHN11_21125 [Xanthobacteraceae bacterium]|jgi:hypothetical protein|nr:hypothetical protein [Xanthobacteraceae bacterium]